MTLSSRCPNCPGEFNPIQGDGPAPCRYLFLGERPGKQENQRGKVFYGPTGQELDDTYLTRAGLYRDEVRLENVVRCWTENNRTPTAEEVRSCGGHFLPSVFAAVRPEFLILLGGSACRIADDPIRLEMHHGRPRYGSVLGETWEGWIWPMYHPAAGLHDGKNMTALLEDFTNLGRWLKGDWWPVQEPEGVQKDYAAIDNNRDLDRYLHCYLAGHGGDARLLACDTEDHGPARFSIQISHTPHTGRMIRDDGPEPVIRAFRDWTRSDAGRSTTWIFHHAAHDLDVLERQWGIAVDPTRFRDTMQEAFHQGNLPQGLKPLVYRLLGVTMTSWEDVVWPASVDALVEWMRSGLVIAGMDHALMTPDNKVFRIPFCGRPGCGHRHKTGPCKRCGCVDYQPVSTRTDYKLGPAGGILKHVLRYTTAEDQDVDNPYHPWKKLGEMRVDGLRGKKAEAWEWEYLEDVLGPLPVLGIGNADRAAGINYGCEDASSTLMVAGDLSRIRQEQKVEGGGLWVDEEDRDR